MLMIAPAGLELERGEKLLWKNEKNTAPGFEALDPKDLRSSLKSLKIQKTPHWNFYSTNYQKLHPYQIPGSKTVNNVKIDLQTT